MSNEELIKDDELLFKIRTLNEQYNEAVRDAKLDGPVPGPLAELGAEIEGLTKIANCWFQTKLEQDVELPVEVVEFAPNAFKL